MACAWTQAEFAEARSVEKRSKADGSRGEAEIGSPQGWVELAIDPGFEHVRSGVVNQTNMSPLGGVGQGACTFIVADANSVATVYVKDPVVDGLLLRSIGGEVHVIEVERVSPGVRDNHRSALKVASDLNVQCEATERFRFQQGVLNRCPRIRLLRSRDFEMQEFSISSSLGLPVRSVQHQPVMSKAL